MIFDYSVNSPDSLKTHNILLDISAENDYLILCRFKCSH